MNLNQREGDERTREYLKRLRATFRDEILKIDIPGPLGMVIQQATVVQHRHAGASDDELLMLYPMRE